jgi:hypothetical protein
MKTRRYLAPLALALAIVGLARTAQAAPIAIIKCETISNPGSYILEGNLTATASNCLTVNASFVSIALNGFTITGPNNAASIGITVGGTTKSTIVEGPGAITNFGSCAKLETDGTATVNNVTMSNCAEVLVGTGLIINNNINCGASFSAGEWGGQISNNVVDNCHTGIIVEAGSNVTNNTINRIIGANLFGLEVNCPSLITNNAVTGYLPFGMPITFGSGGASKCVLTNNLED